MVCIRAATLDDLLGMQKCNLFWCASRVLSLLLENPATILMPRGCMYINTDVSVFVVRHLLQGSWKARLLTRADWLQLARELSAQILLLPHLIVAAATLCSS